MKIHYKLYDYTDKQINRSISQLYRRIFGVNMDENLSFIFYPNPFDAPMGIIAQNEGQQVVGHFATMATAASAASIRILGRILWWMMITGGCISLLQCPINCLPIWMSGGSVSL